MVAPTPEALSSGQVTFTIKTDGKTIPDTIGVVSIQTWIGANKVPTAEVVVFDGSAAQGNFEVSDAKTFVPGAKIEILLGYAGGSEVSVFKGVVVAQAIDIASDTGSTLRVTSYDDALTMTLARRNSIYTNTTDSEFIGKLISQNGLAKSVASTTPKLLEIVQYYATDWDMIVLRAEANGLLVFVEGGKVTVAPPDTSASPGLTVTYGDSLLELHADMDASTQFETSAIQSASWDAATQKVIDAKPVGSAPATAGNLSPATLAKVFGIKEFPQQTNAGLEQSSLTAWSKGEQVKSVLAKIRGTVSYQGSAKVKPGGMLLLQGVGDRFNGAVFVKSVHHAVEGGRWITTAEFGLSPDWFAATQPDVASPGAAGLVPPIEGLQIGKVKAVAKDPAGEFRVQIELPLLRAPGKTVWARLATYYASNKVGDVFYPELEDEVIVGFMNNDPGQPVILGSVYSKKNPPPVAPDEKNNTKAIVTRTRMTLNFDEKDKIITLKTPGGHSVTLDDKTGKVTIADSNKNTVIMSKGGVDITSASNITLKSKANMTLDAGGNLSMKAKANATLEGLQVSHKAKTKFSAEGSAAADLKSSGIVTVKGTLVKIN
jgi:Rhs element Vgr protein